MKCGPRPPRHEHCPGQKMSRKADNQRGGSQQPVLNIHWARALSSSVPEEDAPRRRGTVRKSNMNPKNIGSYKEGEGEEERHGLEAKAGSRWGKHKANVAEERI